MSTFSGFKKESGIKIPSTGCYGAAVAFATTLKRGDSFLVSFDWIRESGGHPEGLRSAIYRSAFMTYSTAPVMGGIRIWKR